MRFSSFTYLVGQGLHNLRANRLMTFASMGVLTVCMLLIGAAYLLGVNIDYMVDYIGNQNETVVYMDDATEEQIAAADAAIRSTPHVVGVTYMSPEDVLATYGDMLKDYTNLQQVFQDDNPFTPNYRVTVDDPDNIEAVSAQLMQIDGVASVKAPLHGRHLHLTAAGHQLRLLRHCSGAGYRVHRGHQQYDQDHGVQPPQGDRHHEAGGCHQRLYSFPVLCGGCYLRLDLRCACLRHRLRRVLCPLRWYAENPSNLSQMFGGQLVPLENVWYYIVGGFVLLGFVLCGLGTATSIRKHLNV